MCVIGIGGRHRQDYCYWAPYCRRGELLRVVLEEKDAIREERAQEEAKALPKSR